MGDLVIISMHEKGFWQADMYREAARLDPLEFETMGLSPDSFFTMKRGATLIDTMHKAKEHWPEARIDLVEEAVEDED